MCWMNMDSPRCEPIDESLRPVEASATQESPAYASLSPLLQESPSYASHSQSKYTQKFFNSGLPNPAPVFASPHVDFHLRQTSFPLRNIGVISSSNTYGQYDSYLNNVLAPCSQKQVESCTTTPESVGKYLVDAPVHSFAARTDANNYNKDDFLTFNVDEVKGHEGFDMFQNHVSLQQQVEEKPDQNAGKELGGSDFSCQSLTGFSPSLELRDNGSEISRQRVDDICRKLQLDSGMHRKEPALSQIQETANYENRHAISTALVIPSQPTRQTADMVRLQNLGSLRKKRERGVSDKTCNCKRSRCLKLYCECFAAGEYCLDSCACANCLNKPEHNDTVQETRELMEDRNPLAFAPKIVPANISPGMGDGSLSTPASARHKNGCNCKRSMCIKRYCECYQVGCCNGCRCEDCQNPHGQKPDSVYQRALHEKWKSDQQQRNAQSYPTSMVVRPAFMVSSTEKHASAMAVQAHPVPGSAGRAASQSIPDHYQVYSLHMDRNQVQPPRPNQLNESESSSDLGRRRFTLKGLRSFPGLSP